MYVADVNFFLVLSAYKYYNALISDYKRQERHVLLVAECNLLISAVLLNTFVCVMFYKSFESYSNHKLSESEYILGPWEGNLVNEKCHLIVSDGPT